MANFSITDFTTLINNHIETHREIEKHLGQIEGIFEFVLTQEFNSVDPATLEVQWKNVGELLCEALTFTETARALNQELQATLVDKALPQLVGNEKPV